MMKSAIAAGALLLLTPGAAMAADKVPVTLKVKDCDGCTISAAWSKSGGSNSVPKSSTKKVSEGKVKFNVPKGYWMYFTGTSPKAEVNAATIVVTQYKGQSVGSTVTAKQSRKLNDGAYYCLTASKQTIKVQAALVKAGSSKLLSLWANPQLKAQGNVVQGGIKGVYGTQNTLLCKGKYY